MTKSGENKPERLKNGVTLTKAEYEMLADFRYALRQFLRFSEQAAHEVGMTPGHHQALLTVKGFHDRERITLTELAERLQIHHNSAVGLVNRLVAHGWLAREAARNDRRQVFIKLTSQGASALRQLTAAHKEELRRIAPELQMFLSRLVGEGEY